MIVYRLSSTKYAKDLTGEGARLHGGRWNQKLTPCIYSSESRALALLEYTVNVNIDFIPRALSMIMLEIPDNILEIKEKDLPGNWKEVPSPASTKDFGTNLLQDAKFPAFKIPSSVIPSEYNYLLNPLHPERRVWKIVDISDFIYDVRIKLV